MKFLNTTNNGKNFTIHFETDDPAEAERVSQFIHDPHSAGMSDDLRAEMHLIITDRDLLKQTVDALKAELQATKDCLVKTNSELDRVARERDEAKGKLEAATDLLTRESREHGGIARETFNIATNILKSDGYNVTSLLDRIAIVYAMKHLRK